jgi:hypothetical protein
MRAISCFRLKNVAKVPPLLNLMPDVQALLSASKRQKRAMRPSLERPGRSIPVSLQP